MSNFRPMNIRHDSKLIKILLFLFTLTLSITVYLLRDQLSQIAALGYIGIFLVTFFSSATILLPLPGALLVVAGGSAFDPLYVALIASLGETAGEMVGYTLGRTGRHFFLIRTDKRYVKVLKLMEKYGSILIFVLAAIPNPIFDIVGVLSGMLKYSLLRFVTFCFLGKLVKNTVLANVGGRIG